MTLTATHTAGRIEVFRGERLVVAQNAAPDSRSFLHPIAAPDGCVLTEDAPPHHPWQHGLYVGLNDVNGVGFWEEGIRQKPQDGSFHPEPLAAPTTSSGTFSWVVNSAWRDPRGQDLLCETQAWAVGDTGDSLVLDVAWTLQASTDLTFGEYAYGGLFLRMPYRAERGGTARSSEGLEGKMAEGQRARWVAVSMLVDDRKTPAGIAILDHPGNDEHPVPWRVDGQLGISPSRCIAGAWSLPSGVSTTARYRVLTFDGDIDADRVEDSWKEFSVS